jgi:hypothetical protein
MLLHGASETDQTTDDDMGHMVRIPPASGIGHRQQSMNRNLILSAADTISGKEQSDMAKAMSDELENLKANMGLDGFGIMNAQIQTEQDEETDVTPLPRPDDHRVSFNDRRSETLSETTGLRQKLENITEKINRIREGLHHKSEDSLLAEINEQLTDIQDQIEDSENLIENNIEPTIGKLQTENERQKQRIKTMKKERKEKEKRERLQKQQEQEEIIERQRVQIERLQKQSPQQTLQTPIKPTHRSTGSLTLDHASPIESDSKLQRRRNSLERSRSQSHYYVVDDDEATDHEFVYGDGDLVHGHPYNPGHIHSAMTAPPGQYDQEPTVIGNSFTGQEGRQYQAYQHSQRPLLSDNAIKVISGVVVVLGVLYIAHKWLSNDRSNRNTMPKILKRAPRVRY